ncbi:MAG: hypothetical protein NUV46_03635 [Nanoarchaeota archaeon]|nr:hypothetical protein [Nanoarchaeota archaeon]
MKKTSKTVLIIVAVVVILVLLYFSYNHFTLSSVSLDEMKYCESRENCVPVDCGCSCSGCGGFSYEEVVNKKFAYAWYDQKGCSPSQVCPEVCCSQRTIECENNLCVVKELQ